MGLWNVFYAKLLELVRFIKHLDEEFLAGEVDDTPRLRQPDPPLH